MTQYMLSVHSGNGAAREPTSREEMEESGRRIAAIETDLKASGAWVFSARLHGAETATVVRAVECRVVTIDGPYVESKEHLGGFYIIAAEDLDDALSWASRVSEAISMPIEVRPFVQTAA
jgi:hypothetical protein